MHDYRDVLIEKVASILRLASEDKEAGKMKAMYDLLGGNKAMAALAVGGGVAGGSVYGVDKAKTKKKLKRAESAGEYVGAIKTLKALGY